MSSENITTVGMVADVSTRGKDSFVKDMAVMGDSALVMEGRLKSLDGAFEKFATSASKKSRPALEQLRKQTIDVFSGLEQQLKDQASTIDRLSKELTKSSGVADNARMSWLGKMQTGSLKIAEAISAASAREDSARMRWLGKMQTGSLKIAETIAAASAREESARMTRLAKMQVGSLKIAEQIQNAADQEQATRMAWLGKMQTGSLKIAETIAAASAREESARMTRLAKMQVGSLKIAEQTQKAADQEQATQMAWLGKMQTGSLKIAETIAAASAREESARMTRLAKMQVGSLKIAEQTQKAADREQATQMAWLGKMQTGSLKIAETIAAASAREESARMTRLAKMQVGSLKIAEQIEKSAKLEAAAVARAAVTDIDRNVAFSQMSPQAQLTRAVRVSALAVNDEGVAYATKKYGSLAVSVGTSADALDKLRARAIAAKTPMQALETEADKAKKKFDALAASARQQASQAVADPRGSFSYLGGANHRELVNVNKDLDTSQKSLNKTLTDAKFAFRGLAGSVGQVYLSYGNLLPLLAGAMVGQGVSSVVKLGADVNNTMKTIQTLSQESAEDVGKLNKQLLELARSGPFGPMEVAEAMKTLSLAGLSAIQVSSGIKDVLDFAVAGNTTIKSAADVLTSVGTAFKIGVEGYGYVGDVIAKTAAVSKSSVEDIGEAFKTSSVINSQYGASLEDVSLGLAVLSNVGIKGTAAGTSLRNAYKDLIHPTTKGAEALKKLGVSALDAFGNTRPLVDILKDLEKGAAALGDKRLSDNLMSQIFSERGAKGPIEAMALLKKKAEETGVGVENVLEEMQQKILDHTAFMFNAAIAMAQTPLNQMKSVKAALEATFVEAFDAIGPQITSLSARLKEIFGSDEFKTALQNIAVGFGNIAVFIADNVQKIGMLIAAVVTLKTALAAGAFLKVVVTELGLMGTALAAAAAGFKTMEAAATGAAAGTAAKLTAGAALARFLPGLGIAITGVTVAWQLYSFFTDKASASNSSAAANTSVLDLLRNEKARIDELNEALSKNISLDELRQGKQAQAALTAAEAAATSEVAAATDRLAKAKAEVKRLDGGLLPQFGAKDTAAAEVKLAQKGLEIAEKNAYIASRDIQTARVQLYLSKAKNEELIKAQALGRKSDTPSGPGIEDGKSGSSKVLDHTKALTAQINLLKLEMSNADKEFANLDSINKRNAAVRGFSTEVEIAATQTHALSKIERQYTIDAINAEKAVVSAEDMLKKLRASKKQDANAIAEAEEALATAWETYDATMRELDVKEDLARTAAEIASTDSGRLANQKRIADAALQEKAALDLTNTAQRDALRLAKSQSELDLMGVKLTVQQRAEITKNAAIAEASLEYEIASKQAVLTLQAELNRLIATGATDIVYAAERAGAAYTSAIAAAKQKLDSTMAQANVTAQATVTAEWVRTFDTISDGILDALEEGGSAGAKSIRKMLWNEIVAKPFRMVVQALIQPIVGGLTNMVTGGATGGSGIFGTLAGLKSTYSTLMGAGSAGGSLAMYGAQGMTGLATDAYQAGLTTIGDGLTGLGNTMLEYADIIDTAGQGIGYLSALYSASEGAWGKAAGEAIGTYILPGIGTVIGGFIGGLVDDWFGGGGGPKTESGYGYGIPTTGWNGDRPAHITPADGGVTGPSGSYVTGLQDRWTDLATMLGISSNLKVGSFIGADPQGDAKTQVQVVANYNGQDIYNRADRVGNITNVGREPEDLEKALEDEGTFVIFNALKNSDLGDQYLAYLNGVAETLPDLATEAEQVAAMNTAIANVSVIHDFTTALEALPFEELKGMSFNAAKGLIEAAGGLSALSANLDGFYANFYTDAEKMAYSVESLGDGFAELGLDMPADGLREWYRAQVDAAMALDQSIPANAEYTATLLAMQAAVNGVTTALEDSIASFRDKFYTDAEKLATGTEQTRVAFAELGLTMPTEGLREWYRAQVEVALALDQTVPANAAYLAGLLAQQDAVAALANGAVTAANTIQSAADKLSNLRISVDDAIEDSEEEAAAAAYAAAKAAYDEAMSVYNAAMDVYNRQVDLLKELRELGNSLLDGSYGNLLGVKDTLSSLRTTYEADLAGARSFDTEAMQRLSGSAKSYVDAQISSSASSVDARRAAALIGIQLTSLKDPTAPTAPEAPEPPEESTKDIIKALIDDGMKALKDLFDAIWQEELTAATREVTLAAGETLKLTLDAIVNAKVNDQTKILALLVNNNLTRDLTLTVTSDLVDDASKALFAEAVAAYSKSVALTVTSTYSDVTMTTLLNAIKAGEENLKLITTLDMTPEVRTVALTANRTLGLTLQTVLTTPGMSEEQMKLVAGTITSLERTLNLTITSAWDDASKIMVMEAVESVSKTVELVVKDFTGPDKQLLLDAAAKLAKDIELTVEAGDLKTLQLLTQQSTALEAIVNMSNGVLSDEVKAILASGNLSKLVDVSLRMAAEQKGFEDEMAVLLAARDLEITASLGDTQAIKDALHALTLTQNVVFSALLVPGNTAEEIKKLAAAQQLVLNAHVESGAAQDEIDKLRAAQTFTLTAAIEAGVAADVKNKLQEPGMVALLATLDDTEAKALKDALRTDAILSVLATLDTETAEALKAVLLEEGDLTLEAFLETLAAKKAKDELLETAVLQLSTDLETATSQAAKDKVLEDATLYLTTSLGIDDADIAKKKILETAILHLTADLATAESEAEKAEILKTATLFLSTTLNTTDAEAAKAAVIKTAILYLSTDLETATSQAAKDKVLEDAILYLTTTLSIDDADIAKKKILDTAILYLTTDLATADSQAAKDKIIEDATVFLTAALNTENAALAKKAILETAVLHLSSDLDNADSEAAKKDILETAVLYLTTTLGIDDADTVKQDILKTAVLDLSTDLDTAQSEADKKKILETATLDLSVKLGITDAEAVKETLLEDATLGVTADLDTTDAEDAKDDFLEGVELAIGTSLDSTGFDSDLEYLLTYTDAEIEIDSTIDKTGFNRDMQDILDGSYTVTIGTSASSASAQGNIFQSGSLTPFALGGLPSNSVLNQPTLFNIGLAGEAGPEAIMPLQRMRDGALGVRADMSIDYSRFKSDSNAALVAEIKALRAEVASLRAEQRAGHTTIASNTSKTSKVLQKWDSDGQPAVAV